MSGNRSVEDSGLTGFRDWVIELPLLKTPIRKFLVAGFGAISIFAMLGGSYGLLVAIVDGIYYRNLHSQLVDCSEFVGIHIEQNSSFPDSDALTKWGREHGVSRRFYIGAPDSGTSFGVLEGKPAQAGAKDYRVAHWDGDRFEFYNVWDRSFTTSRMGHSGRAFVVGVGLLVVGFVFYRMRKRIAGIDTGRTREIDI